MLKTVTNQVRSWFRQDASKIELDQDSFRIRLLESGVFDTDYYRSENPDVVESGMDPLEHFIFHGDMERRKPNRSFDSENYFNKYLKDNDETVGPVRHFLNNPGNSAKLAESNCPDFNVVLASAIFDENFYAKQNPRATEYYKSLSQGDIESLLSHYLTNGWKDGLDPGPNFSTSYYLDTYADVRRSGTNPLLHFLRFGWRELRNPSPEFDTGWYWLTQVKGDPEIEPLSHYIRNRENGTTSRPSSSALNASEKALLIDAVREAINNPRAGLIEYRSIATYAESQLLWSLAEEAYARLTALDANSVVFHKRYATTLEKQGKWWLLTDVLKKKIDLEPNRAELWYRLGRAYEAMLHWPSAVSAYRTAVSFNPKNNEWKNHLAFCLEKQKNYSEAEAIYAEVETDDSTGKQGRFGEGVFHQSRGHWKQAAIAYERRADREPLDADLQFRIGMAYDRCYQWERAERAYKRSLALNPDFPERHFRLGFVLERSEKYKEAAMAYSAAISKRESPPGYWSYRRGVCLVELGLFEEACEAFICSESYPLSLSIHRSESNLFDYFSELDQSELISDCLDLDQTRADWHFQLGSSLERKGFFGKAANAYAEAIKRDESSSSEWKFRFASTLYQSGKYERACMAFIRIRKLGKPYGVDQAKYATSSEAEELMVYCEAYENEPIDKNIIVYESMLGSSIGGNPYAIFSYIINCPQYAEMTHVWVIKKETFIPSWIRKRKNIVIVLKSGSLYRRYLACAGWLINDVTFPHWFIRKDDQKYLNTWHGTPMKCLGKDIPGEFMSHSNIARNFLQATHIISPNRHTTEVVVYSFDISNLLTAKVAETGYPRMDITLSVSEERKRELRDSLGIAHGESVVLYAPTWRGTHGAAEADIALLRNDLLRLKELPCRLLFRGHHLSEKFVLDEMPGIIIAGKEFEINELLSIVDILITDYSSVAFDFMPLLKPILYYDYDIEEYRKSRGLYFDPETLPGKSCPTLTALITAVSDILGGKEFDTHNYSKGIETYCSYDDGDASKRAVEFLFEESYEEILQIKDRSKNRILFFAGALIPNGITSSFINLTEQLANEGHSDVTIIMDPNSVLQDSRRMQKFSQLSPNIQSVGRCGRMVMTLEEAALISRFNSRREIDGARMWSILKAAFEREYRRIFGVAVFNQVIQFEGYSVFWSQLLGLGAGKSNAIIYMHNDMMAEFSLRHPYLRQLFSLYEHYDSLVSVSETMSNVNKNKLSSEFSISPEKFRACINCIDSEEVLKRASASIDSDMMPWFGWGPSFITIGRMSPEKSHAKLIAAFKAVVSVHPDAKLIIIGDGPLHQAIKTQISLLELNDSVFLAGQRENPFPALAAADCFVLPSDHEGQPMVLLEAMVLGKPIVATNIDGNRGAIKSGYGRVVDNSVEGLSSGMMDFISGMIVPGKFDEGKYLERALREFKELLN